MNSLVLENWQYLNKMSDAGDDIPVEAAVVEVAAEAPKGKLSVEDALQVGFF